MQVTETHAEGLKRGFRVHLAAAELVERLDGQLAELRGKAQIKGFRPGKVPLAHLKRLYGRSAMADVVQDAVNEASRKIVADHGLRLAQEPRVELPKDEAEVARALEAKGDLAFDVAVEVLPKFEVGALDDLALERPVAPVEDAQVDRAIDGLAERLREYKARDAGAGAQKGDRLTIDFAGEIDGKPFEGGKGEGIKVKLGSGEFIPGFEDALVGAKAGDKRRVSSRFPDEYANAALAGKPAEFDVEVRAVEAPEAMALDDDFAKKMGFESAEAMRAAARGSIEAEHARASRDKVKRQLLDRLDKRYSFDLPEGLVDQEFQNIWRQAETERGASGRSFADDSTTEEEARADFRRIAERRVRLGLLLAEVGDKAKVEVTDQEMTQALIERARAFPGREKEIWDFYRKNPQSLAELRAPIYEEKVVDHLIGQAKVTERTVTREELTRIED
ncbi:MAG: trigger factor [Hyphomicrobiales bacterium]|nr:trigger factor [Hyphomicrobiales bacterium]MDE2016499.1 trigger factor [Hyphomicrobiales bacterium]